MAHFKLPEKDASQKIVTCHEIKHLQHFVSLVWKFDSYIKSIKCFFLSKIILSMLCLY